VDPPERLLLAEDFFALPVRLDDPPLDRFDEELLLFFELPPLREELPLRDAPLRDEAPLRDDAPPLLFFAPPLREELLLPREELLLPPPER